MVTVGSQPFIVIYGWLRAWLYFVMCGACVFLLGQAAPHIPDFVELPSIPDQSELIPLRPFLLSSDHNASESVSMRGKSVRRGPTGWVLESGAIESGDRLLLADHIQYNPNTNSLEANGNIRFESLKFSMYCNQLNMDWDKKSGEATNLKFELPPKGIIQSEKVKFKDLQKWDFNKVTISPGVEEHPGWKITASNLKVDLEHYAHGKNLWLWVFGVPTYYFIPYVIYPVKEQRASGFLPLKLQSDSISIPYYQVL